jgi:hypothetical protein
MAEKIKTSISINPYYKHRLYEMQAILGEPYQKIIKKLLYMLLKRINNLYSINRQSRSYQPKSKSCRPLTVNYTPEEYEFILNIGMVTRISISFLVTIAIECFGDRVLEKAGKSRKALCMVKNLFQMSLRENFHLSYGKYGLFRGIFLNNEMQFNYFPYFDSLIFY